MRRRSHLATTPLSVVHHPGGASHCKVGFRKTSANATGLLGHEGQDWSRLLDLRLPAVPPIPTWVCRAAAEQDGSAGWFGFPDAAVGGAFGHSYTSPMPARCRFGVDGTVLEIVQFSGVVEWLPSCPAADPTVTRFRRARGSRPWLTVRATERRESAQLRPRSRDRSAVAMSSPISVGIPILSPVIPRR
jgi:hypothetical protein